MASGLLIRSVPAHWTKAIADGDLHPSLEAPPAWALGVFAPGARERADISIYRIPSRDDIILASVAMELTKSDVKAVHWAIVDEVQAAEAGLRWQVDGAGASASDIVNAWHAALSIETIDDLLLAVKVFSADFAVVERRTAEGYVETAVRSNQIIFRAPSKGEAGKPPYTKLPNWIADGWAVANGNPA